MNKTIRLLISCSIAAIMSVISLLDVFYGSQLPRQLFKIIGLLIMPGNLVMIIIVSIIMPSQGWTAIHMSGNFKYVGHVTNVIVYFLIVYWITGFFVKKKSEGS